MEVKPNHLLPCAFCGCTKSPVRQGNGIGDYWLECTECGASTKLREDGAGNEKDWNRRPDVVVDLSSVAPQAAPIWTTDASLDVLAERARQAGAEGFTPTHDDQHDDGVLVCAAIAYAGADTVNHPINEPPDMWPWAREWWKPSDDRRNLVKAAALIIAEIERLDRAGGTA